jgi:restriction endonuclease Mrr
MPIPDYQTLMLPVLKTVSDGELMIEFNVGITATRTYIVKEVDSDYFEN